MPHVITVRCRQTVEKLEVVVNIIKPVDSSQVSLKHPMDFSEIFRQLPNMDVILNKDLEVIEATDMYINKTHNTRENLIGKNLFEAFPVNPRIPELRDKILNSLQLVIKSGKTDFIGTFQYDLQDKTTLRYYKKFWNAYSIPLMSKQGIAGVIHRVEDVSELQSVEGKLKSAEVFKLLVENVKDYAIFMLDANGIIRTWNDGAKRLKYYDAEEIIGKHFSVFYTEEDLKKNKPENELKSALKEGRTEDEYWRVRKDGTLFWGNVVITTIRDASGTLIGFAKVTRDLTERKANEEKVLHAFEETARLKSEFLANMSHEIRTPMNGVISAASLLEEETLTKEQKDLLEIITTSGKAMLKIVNDILDYTKLDSKELTLMEEAFNLKYEMDQIVKVYKDSFTNKNVAMKMNVDGSVPEMVLADKMRFRQVFTNIFDNAVKFTEKGYISVDASMKQTTVGEMLHVEITDTGIGIDSADLKKLFQPFTQLDASTRKKFKGTGLGLSICKRLVELMHGTIGVVSEVGKGSKFWFEIKISAVSTPEIKRIKKPNADIPSAHKPEASILVVEDNAINQNVILRVLRRLGYTNIDVAADGQVGVESFQKKQYDLILMDVQMPIMDGYDATRKIRETNKNIPIVAMTANALAGDPEKCIQAGMNDYLSKPVNFKNLAVVLNRWIEKL